MSCFMLTTGLQETRVKHDPDEALHLRQVLPYILADHTVPSILIRLNVSWTTLYFGSLRNAVDHVWIMLRSCSLTGSGLD